jgi:hypothetical protein
MGFGIRRLFYIRGILRRRLAYINEYMLMDLMEAAVAHDIDLDWMESFAKRVSSNSGIRLKIT